MRDSDIEQLRQHYLDLLAEVQAVAARVRERIEMLRTRFPEDESLSAQSDGSAEGRGEVGDSVVEAKILPAREEEEPPPP